MKNLKNYYNRLINKMSSFLEKNEKLSQFLFEYFDYSSKFTQKILFDLRYFIPLCFLFYLVPALYFEQTLGFFMYLSENGLNTRNLIQAFLTELEFPLRFFFFFYFILFETVLFNTFLCQLEFIKKKMIQRYGNPLILKERGYNSTIRSMARVAALGATTMFGIGKAAETVKQLTEAEIELAKIKADVSRARFEAVQETNRLRAEEAARTGKPAKLDPIPSHDQTETSAEVRLYFKDRIRMAFGYDQSKK